MKVLLLAGGLGTRLGKITRTTPKPMIKIAGKPVIKHIIDNLHEAGLTDIIVKLHYLPTVIMDYLGDSVLYYYEKELCSASETIKKLNLENFMVINADTLSNVDYKQMIKYHDPSSITALMDEWRCAGTWIYPSSKTLSVKPYRPKGLLWFDIGLPERLEAAKNYFERYDKN